VSIGESLAEARRRAGLTTADVSQRTRIRESIIRGIESGDFSACGGDFYARGHIRSIASAVGTDPVPLISEYDAEHGPLGSMRAADVFEPSTPIRIREPRRSPSLTMIVAVVLLAIIGFGTYRLVDSHHGGSKPLASPSHPVSAVANPKPRTSPAPSARSTVVIKLTALEDCWVQITRSSDGSQIYMGTILAGSSMTWKEKHAVQVQLGNPPGVVLTVNGKRQSTNVNNPVTLRFAPNSSSVSSSPSASSTSPTSASSS
jgi:cytoskeletal protein RodZ